IPVGAIVDATKGKVRLTSIDASGREQSAVFFGGVFQVVQRSGGGPVVLRLRDTFACPAPASQGRGSAAAAPVSGTIVLVKDRCNETTFFRTRRGVVTVKDFVKGTPLKLPAGKTY